MRLDNYLVEKEFFDSRTKAKQAIERGEILINNKKVLKASFEIKEDNVEIKHVYESKFVSLGGYKLEKALNDFNFAVNDLVVADVGASTGGFTDCLLQNGAKKVFAVDLNDTLLHSKLRSDDRVISIVKNAKDLNLSDFTASLDLIVADLSFISITQVVDVFSSLLSSGKNLILLIKPQFEMGEHKRFKNGIIKDKKIHDKVCENVIEIAKNNNLEKIDITSAPIYENKNLEFLLLLRKK